MTAIAFGAALIGNEAQAASPQPSLSQLLIPQAPVAQPAVSPIRFGEQLRQQLSTDALTTRLAAPPVATESTLDDLLSQETAPAEEETAIDALPTFSGLITFTQPIAVPLEYAQRSLGFSQQPQASLPIEAVAQPTAARAQLSFNVLSALPEPSALGAATINAAATALVSKGAAASLPMESQSALSTTQLGSLTNAGLVQSLVEGMTQQPGVLAPVASAPAPTLNTQRSALEVALGDRLQLQITQRSEHAVIRLDPPSMGTIEIVIQREAGHIQVQLRASNPDVARQLHGIGDSLRQDLIHRQHGDVSVHVSDSSREQSASQQGQRQSQAQREAPGRALSETNEESSKSFTLAVDEERGA